MAKGKKKNSKGKKSSKKPQETQRSARTIQTPYSDEEISSKHASDGESLDPQKRSPRTVRHGRIERSPTRKDDFAPGQLSDDYESNYDTDSDLENASMQDAPIEDQPDAVGRWVKEIIKEETQKESDRMVHDFFTSAEPQYDQCEVFFRRLNQQIRAANDAHDVNDVDNGIIPERGYVDLCRTWRQEHSKAKERMSPEDAWNAFHNTRELLKYFNQRHYLPKTWNISSAWAEQEIGSPDPRIEQVTDKEKVLNSDHESLNARQSSATKESDVESDMTSNDDQPTGLDALEARTMKEQRSLTSAKVLYWWPKGTGSQIFVRYGDRHTPIYRIRAGSYESYNPSQVERVLVTKTRGTAKVAGTRNGIPDEWWKYERKHVADLIGVGWKIEEDDENGTDALGLLRPEKGTLYPQTRTLVKWKDGVFTLEGRAFIRRITVGSALEGDRVLYQKASEMESAYRRKHGIDETSGESSDEEPDYDARWKRRTSNRIGFEESDTESEPSPNASSARDRRPRGRVRQGRRQKDDGNVTNAKIKELERQLRQLKMERSVSPWQMDDRAEARRHAKPRRRATRGQTA